jgi:signal transduction histidine kinase
LTEAQLNDWSQQAVMRKRPGSHSAEALAALLVACAFVAVLHTPAATQSPQKAVLVLIPLQRGSSVSTDIDGTIRTILNDGLAGRLDYYTEYLDVARFPESDYEPAVRDFFRRKYISQTFDVVVAPTNAMVDFVIKYRDELFPGATVVFAAGSPRSGPKMTGVVFPLNMKSSIDIAIQLHPDLRQVFVVSGVSDSDRVYQDLAREQFRTYDGRLGFTYSSGLAMPDLLRRLAELPQHTIVYFLSFFDDGHGSKFDDLAALDRVVAVANVPTYVWLDTREGHGGVGGSVLSVERAAGAIADVALRVLKGESPETIPVREIDPNIAQFDWRQLQRWGISESRLPAGSLVRFRQPSLWDQYKLYVIGATSVVVLQTALIAGLVVQRAKRRRAEVAVRESASALRQSFEQNQDLAGRLINAQEEERTRIARDLHDDVSQQLASVSIMLSGLKRNVAKPGSALEVEQTISTLQDRAARAAEAVRTLSHELHPSVLEHAGLVSALRRHCAEVEAHHQVNVSFSGEAEDLETLKPDVALCLFRVTQEALTNAVRHARASAIRVELMWTPEATDLRIIDDGIGFVPGEHAGSGLGLRSIDERVRLSRGEVTLESQIGQGTTLRVRIPHQVPCPE